MASQRRIEPLACGPPRTVTNCEGRLIKLHSPPSFNHVYVSACVCVKYTQTQRQNHDASTQSHKLWILPHCIAFDISLSSGVCLCLHIFVCDCPWSVCLLTVVCLLTIVFVLTVVCVLICVCMRDASLHCIHLLPFITIATSICSSFSCCCPDDNK